ncbi:aminotransferase class V-fold PLP-dependent enzyme [Natronolimnohabitans sp. A-GB9]|uniref:aminotransferase class V-fold PLP-dependent enzyme n=1 Tax=Natronolimnohabitans sp. A-GB9 TaxID=3069757 RepID=UPI0027B5CDCE|nr:aminotransferase class V-fold PLP-dependent enzyme [Natronolimnohabitans sp. A-GB9]MDQ2050707.1 aminotransferase class V-fold PLP-dependent enzyme [Natronolimnohabitans sp. A-GB9]
MTPLELRETIPALESGAYLNWGAGGPSPRHVVEAAESTLEHHEYDAPTAEGQYPAAFDAYDDGREAVAGLLGATPAEIALTESTTDGINRVAGALEWDETDVVVRTDLEHSAGILPWQRLERERGVDVRVLETERGRLDLEAVKAVADDATLFCVSSLTWTHGTRLPISELVEIAHDAGALVLVDAVQTPGQRPIDVKEWGADFVAAAGHKWLAGPFGSGFLYVREGLECERALVPAAIGYRSVTAENAAEYELEAGARRFEVATASPAPHAGLAAAIERLESIGLAAIETRIETLTDRLKGGLDDEQLLSPREFESGLVTIDVDDPETAVEHLSERGIVLRSLPGPDAIRASVHAFNTREDVDALLEALRTV